MYKNCNIYFKSYAAFHVAVSGFLHQTLHLVSFNHQNSCLISSEPLLHTHFQWLSYLFPFNFCYQVVNLSYHPSWIGRDMLYLVSLMAAVFLPPFIPSIIPHDLVNRSFYKYIFIIIKIYLI